MWNKYKITGLRIEKYIGETVSGHNCDFEYKDELLNKYVVCAIRDDKQKVEIELTEDYGECGSGWTTVSWGEMVIKEVDRFNGYTHKPIKNIEIEIEQQKDYLSCETYFENEVFTCSYDGGDSYYPSGHVYVNMELFKPMIRHKEERPVWLFKGVSNSGKSFIASHLKLLNTYETDSNNVLPDVIKADVVVLGNKYEFTVEDIKSRIFGEYELILVDFSTEIENKKNKMVQDFIISDVADVVITNKETGETIFKGNVPTKDIVIDRK